MALAASRSSPASRESPPPCMARFDRMGIGRAMHILRGSCSFFSAVFAATGNAGACSVLPTRTLIERSSGGVFSPPPPPPPPSFLRWRPESPRGGHGAHRRSRAMQPTVYLHQAGVVERGDHLRLRLHHLALLLRQHRGGDIRILHGKRPAKPAHVPDSAVGHNAARAPPAAAAPERLPPSASAASGRKDGRSRKCAKLRAHIFHAQPMHQQLRELKHPRVAARTSARKAASFSRSAIS